MQHSLIKKHSGWVLVLALIALIIPVVLIQSGVLQATGGKLIYPLDDTYIHMAIAKNLALHNNWGISPNQFQSASSSILYTLVLTAAFKIFSVNTLVPFIINFIAAIVLLIVIQQRLQKENISFIFQLIVLLLVIFFTPLPVIIISGMEHTLQCLFSFLFIFGFADYIEKIQHSPNNKIKLPVSLYVYGFIICGLRYEGLFIIAIACCILLYYRKTFSAFALGFISVLPLLLFGIFSVMKGSYFLPNSVLLKSSPVALQGRGIAGFVSNILIDKLTIAATGITALATQRLLLILPLTFLLFREQVKKSVAYSIVILILFVCTFLQLAFASTGWFYRYEAYLVLCTTVIVSILFIKYFKQWYAAKGKLLTAVLLLVAFFLVFPFVLRSAAAYSKATQASINIFEQQFQIGKFIKEYYDNKSVAVNDIGAVSYFNNANILDLWGLANIQIAEAKKSGGNTPEFLNAIVHNEQVDIAIVYDTWFNPGLLDKWQKVAAWTIENNVICGDATVSFYAVKPGSASSLKTNLKAYQQLLPKAVKVEYY